MGRGWTRTHASVMTPSVPSEPTSSRSGLGPAPEPGSRRDSHMPVGAIARTDSTKSSMCVHTVAKCPAARVAIQPPSVESSNDCGKWRSVRPCSGQLGLQVRPAGTALDACGARDLVHLDHFAQSREVDRDRSVVAGTHIGLHPTDHARATPIGDRRDALGCAPLQQPLDVALIARRSDKVGGMLEMAAEAEHDIRVGLAQRMGGAGMSVGSADVG